MVTSLRPRPYFYKDGLYLINFGMLGDAPIVEVKKINTSEIDYTDEIVKWISHRLLHGPELEYSKANGYDILI